MQRKTTESADRFLSEASNVLASSFDLSLTLPRIAHLTTDHLADCCLIEIIDEEGRSALAAVACGDQRRESDVSRAYEAGGPDGSPPIALSALDAPWWYRLELELILVEPIIVRERKLGAIAFATAGLSGGARPVDRDLTRNLSSRLGSAILNARSYMRERRVARSFQTALLPTTFPKLPGHAFHTSYAPATDEAEVGGDWYDAFDLPDGRIAMSIGDVAGHGLDAAVVMAEVRQTFRVAAMENRTPGAVLDMANRLLVLRPEPTMVTAIFGIYDGRTFTYATAGHPPPILAASGVVDPLPFDGIPLGVEVGPGRPSWTATISPGSMLVLYTDGLIEFGRDVVDGERNLIEAVRAELADPSENPAESIRQRVLGSRRNVDDVAVLTMAVAESPVTELDLHYTAAPVAAPLVRQAVSKFATQFELTAEQSFALSLSIGEAVNNVIEHAYLSGPGTLSVRVRRDADKIFVSVQDRGRWRPARSEGRGRGLLVMRSLMDTVEVNLTQGGTILKMVYDLNGRGDQANSEIAIG